MRARRRLLVCASLAALARPALGGDGNATLSVHERLLAENKYAWVTGIAYNE